jgi:hypothetical protein
MDIKMSETELREAKNCLYTAYKNATKYMAEHENCNSACYTGYESDSIKIEVRIKRKQK